MGTTTRSAEDAADSPWAVGNAADEAPLRAAPYGRTAEAWSMLRWQWLNSALPSVQACRRSSYGNSVGITLGHDGRASVSGVRTCGSATACPLCSARVWAKRSDELAHTLRAVHAAGMAAVFITVTMRHERADSLSTLWDALTPALTKATTATGTWAIRRWQTTHGYVGQVRRNECTHGSNGYHLHAHLLWLVEVAPDTAGLTGLRRDLHSAWSDALPEGLRPSDEHGVKVALLDIGRAERAAADYMTAAGSFGSAERIAAAASRAAAEYTDATRKTARHGNRTMWEVLRDAAAGHRASARIWREWEETSKGRQSWRVSPALTKLAAEHVEPVGVEQPEPETLVNLTANDWKLICREHDPAQLLDDVEAAYRDAVSRGYGREEGVHRAAISVLRTLQRWNVTTAPT